MNLIELEQELLGLPLTDTEEGLVILLFRLLEIETKTHGKPTGESLKSLEKHTRRIKANVEARRGTSGNL